MHRARPDPGFLPHPFATQPSNASYRSGRELFVATIAIVAFLLVRGTAARVLVATAGLVVVTTAGPSVAIDGVHYLTDVAASVLRACTTIPAIMLFSRRWALPCLTRQLQARRWILS